MQLFDLSVDVMWYWLVFYRYTNGGGSENGGVYTTLYISTGWITYAGLIAQCNKPLIESAGSPLVMENVSWILCKF